MSTSKQDALAALEAAQAAYRAALEEDKNASDAALQATTRAHRSGDAKRAAWKKLEQAYEIFWSTPEAALAEVIADMTERRQPTPQGRH